jgi:hypothetical protein
MEGRVLGRARGRCTKQQLLKVKEEDRKPGPQISESGDFEVTPLSCRRGDQSEVAVPSPVRQFEPSEFNCS